MTQKLIKKLINPNNSKPYMLLDVSSICYRAFFSLGGLSSGNSKTGVIFGFLSQVLKLAKLFKTDKFIFCFDSSKSYRKMMYPEYKSNRISKEVPLQEKRDKQEFYRQVNELRMELLPALGFKNIFIGTGFEADDILAYVVNQNKCPPFIIVATDQDLYQLLSYDTYMYNPNSKELLDRDWFCKTFFDLDPWWHAEMKSIAGCSTDNVAGIKGVGETYAFRYLKGELKETSKAYKAIESKAGQEIIKRNRKLVFLPYKGKKIPDCKINKREKFKRKKFIEIFEKYEFISFLKKLDDWKEYFGLE